MIDALAKLLEQGAHADESVKRATSDESAELRTAAYAGMRDVTLGSGPFRMFAVAIDTPRGPRDIVLTRTPELAHFIAQIIRVGDELFPMLAKAMEGKG